MASKLQERKEQEAQVLNAALGALTRARHCTRRRRELIAGLFQGEGYLPEEAPDYLHALARELRWCADPARDAFRRLLLQVEAHADRLLTAPAPQGGYISALQRLAHHGYAWQAPVEGWRPASKSPARQFAQLTRFLLARYPVPAFLDMVFFLPELRSMEPWFQHVGQGGSIRTAPGMSLPLTKRMGYFFMQAPDYFNVVQALRWGQVLGFSGSPRLAHTVCATRLGREIWNSQDEEWWSTVVQWFVNHPMLDPAQVGPIVDYLHFRRFGDPQEGHTPDYLFEMPGRSPAAVLRLVAGWHRELNRSRDRRFREFRPCGLSVGQWSLGPPRSDHVWMLSEILDSNALAEEGRAMQHCVESYADSIMKGTCSIWTLKVDRYGTMTRAVTVELENATRTIVQVRGKLNRWPTDEELEVLQRWASEYGFHIQI